MKNKFYKVYDKNTPDQVNIVIAGSAREAKKITGWSLDLRAQAVRPERGIAYNNGQLFSVGGFGYVYTTHPKQVDNNFALFVDELKAQKRYRSWYRR